MAERTKRSRRKRAEERLGEAARLGPHDHVLTAYAERAAGPGWANRPLWIIVRSRLDGSLRQECLQPEEQTPGMLALYDISEAAHRAMVGELRRAVPSESL